jgi:hypothetical protein
VNLPVPKKRLRLFLASAFAVIALVSLAFTYAIVAKKQEVSEATRREQARLAYEASPEAKEAMADREFTARKAETQEFMQAMFARTCQNTFLDRGLDVHCSVSDEQTLLITGSPVNRAFADRFMRERSAIQTIKGFGFTTISFWNGKTNGFSSDMFMREFDLTSTRMYP